MYLLGGYDGTDRLQDLYSIDIGALRPPSLLDICADYVRTNLDSVLETTTFKGVPHDIIDNVIFKRDLEGQLRGNVSFVDQVDVVLTECKKLEHVQVTI
ncbi:hypothetical protein PsorP6_010528 [Peronosclerospora sorghi]|uniref:Uncharacterized protein n=1 Tax=Peronosclerospora sorghi TaxID=230839 RepID=A0ACC0VX12_9STRA|nr:hypothetical protein PsorP6_010528 [Peronosclerospora sorghi]